MLPPRIVAVVAVVALAASAVVVAVASTTANGLPAYTNGYQKWPAEPQAVHAVWPSCAHGGRKNVYVSKRKVGKRFPNGTVIVKTIVKPGTSYVGQFAVMRKVTGAWRYVEYERSSATARYGARAGHLPGCHAQAKANDYVFDAVGRTAWANAVGASALVRQEERPDATDQADDADDPADDASHDHEDDPSDEEPETDDVDSHDLEFASRAATPSPARLTSRARGSRR